MRGLIRFLRRLCDREDGSPAIEFAFVAPILILMVIGTIEFGMIMFVTILMESGLRDAARYGITGNEFGGMNRMERIVQIINDRTMGLVDINQADIQILVYRVYVAEQSLKIAQHGTTRKPAGSVLETGPVLCNRLHAELAE